MFYSFTLIKRIIFQQEWEEKAAKAKKEYNDAMKDYVPSEVSKPKDKKEKTEKTEKTEKSDKKKKETKKESPTKVSSGSFKSKEYISDDDTSSDEDNKKKVLKITIFFK